MRLCVTTAVVCFATLGKQKSLIRLISEMANTAACTLRQGAYQSYPDSLTDRRVKTDMHTLKNTMGGVSFFPWVGMHMKLHTVNRCCTIITF